VNALTIHTAPGDAQPLRGALMCGDALAVYGQTPDGAWLQVRGVSSQMTMLPSAD